jgi:uncharacterized membrane protein
MKKQTFVMWGMALGVMVLAANAHGWGKFKTLSPQNGKLSIPVEDVSDGKAHYFQVKADDGIHVKFFVLMSQDGILRAAVDACDVCYRSGKGYVQEGDFMVCTNCGRRFASDRINEVKGGCNPAPLNRKIVDKHLVIAMADINENSWYCKFK